MNFVALVFCPMLGTAAMPHMLTLLHHRQHAGGTRRSVGWTLLFITLLYLAAPTLAVLVRPRCSAAWWACHSTSCPTGCSAGRGWTAAWCRWRTSTATASLQLGELRLASDVIVLIAPELGGLPVVVTYLVAAGGLAAAFPPPTGCC